MKRTRLDAFRSWLTSNTRRPLVIRGARQVGKTWIVRDLAKSASLTLLELNFERNPEYAKLFSARSPQAVYDEITLELSASPPPQKALLFLDEIQSAPELLAQLRWFSEEMPELAVIAAGSLLEFALAAMPQSMPVGRIRYGFLEPMSFEEYLIAHQQDDLLKRWASWLPGMDVSETLHKKTLEHFDRFQMTGGMPAVVSAAINEANAAECRQIQRDLIQTYRDDFFKYSGRMHPGILNATLLATVHEMGKKFIYSHVDESIQHYQAKHALELLAMSRLCTLIPHTQANGLPLGAQMNERIRKVSKRKLCYSPDVEEKMNIRNHKIHKMHKINNKEYQP